MSDGEPLGVIGGESGDIDHPLRSFQRALPMVQKTRMPNFPFEGACPRKQAKQRRAAANEALFPLKHELHTYCMYVLCSGVPVSLYVCVCVASFLWYIRGAFRNTA